MVGTRNKSAHRNKALYTLYFCIYCRFILTQCRFIHSSDTEDLFTVFLTRTLKLISPSSNLDREQNVYAVFDPRRNKLFGNAVAVKRNNVNTVFMTQIVALFIVLCTQLIKDLGRKERPALEANILPVMCKIKFCSCC